MLVDIYALTDPEKGVRYIGQSRHVRRRYCSHMREAKKGKPLSPEHGAKIGRANSLRTCSAETRKKAAAAKVGNKYALGCKRSLSTLRKMSEAAHHGGMNSRALVTDEQATEIRRLFSLGVRQCDIALRCNVNRICVHRIVRNKTHNKP